MDVLVMLVLSILTLVWWGTGVYGDIYVRDLTTDHTVKTYSDMQAAFGPDFPSDGLEGWLVYASPDHEACRPVDPPPINETTCNTTLCNYILLIARGGNCEFSDKVLTAQNAGYAAAIVHNFQGNNSQVEMQSCKNGSLVNIPATFVGYSSGMDMLHNYMQREYVIVIVEDYEDFRFFLWPFGVAVGVCFIMFLVFMLVKFLRDHTRKNLNRLSRRQLKKIPVRKFKKGDYYDTCAICLDEYEEGEKIRVLPCDHVYHVKCIDPWLTRNNKTCPVCKRHVIPGKDGAESHTDSEEVTGESENTPLLAGGSGPSHGSIAEPAAVNTSHSDMLNRRPGIHSTALRNTSMRPLGSDVENGAVGGEGISDSHQTLLSIATANNAQEGNEGRDPHSDRKRKRKELMTTAEEEEEAASTSLGLEARSERRERRKHKRDKKKKSENRSRPQISGDAVQVSEEGRNEEIATLGGEVNSSESDGSVVRTHEGGAYVNPSYSDSHEVVVPAGGDKREMSEVV